MAETAVQELKLDVRKSFARIYSALKARELQTLRQIEAVSKRPVPPSRTFPPQVSFDNEERLFDEIRKFGSIDFAGLGLDGDVFVMEDYVSPADDHMRSDKSIDEDRDSGSSSLEATPAEETAPKIPPIPSGADGCVCRVRLSPEEVSQKLKEYDKDCASDPVSAIPEKNEERTATKEEDPIVSEEESESDGDSLTKPNPTQHWLNQIMTETETEPSQVIDLMEHSAIECS